MKLPDRGIFVSIAERLLAGDKLYVDVWENKDPIFYYMISLGRVFSPYADVVLEILLEKVKFSIAWLLSLLLPNQN